MVEEFLKEENRAEDILLGSLGIGEDAKILSIEESDGECYRGTARWPDGEVFTFESDEPMDDLQRWALSVIRKLLKSA